MIGPPPRIGESVTVLHLYVAELYRHVQALENMRVIIHPININGNTVSANGQLLVLSDSSVLSIS